jgi:hypothetical protein
MPLFDDHSNFAYSSVVVPPVPPLTGLSLSVSAGEGIIFPAPPFNIVVWPVNQMAVRTNAEILRVTEKVGDTFTVLRAQEGTSARAIQPGDQVGANITVKTISDIEQVVTRNLPIVFAQLTPSAVWTIEHNRDRYPFVYTTDSAGTPVVGETFYPDANTVVIQFSVAFSGNAYLTG